MVSEQLQLITYDQIKLFVSKSKIEEPKANIIIVHGLGEHSGRYAYVIEKLCDAGFNIYTYDHRGHGKSEGVRAYVNDYCDFLKDLQQIVAYVKQDSSNLKNIILGHSMGGFITTLYGIKTNDDVDGIILSGAATQPTKMKNSMRMLIKTLGRISPKYAKGNDLGKIVSRDVKVVQDYIDDPLNCKKITMGLYNQFVIRGVDFVKANLAEFKYPVLILHGENDLIVDHEFSKILYEKISSTDKTLKIYPELYHEILNEPERDTVIEDIVFWINNHK